MEIEPDIRQTSTNELILLSFFSRLFVCLFSKFQIKIINLNEKASLCCISAVPVIWSTAVAVWQNDSQV